MEENYTVIALAGIIVLGVSAKWISWATRIPSILLLLFIGIVVGPVLGWIHPKELFGDLLLPIISLAVAIVLFEGGLSLRFKDVVDVSHVIALLVTLGAAISFTLSTVFLYYVLDFSLTFSLLESAILIVTGPTVIIPLINQLNVKEPVRSILRWEGIIIDPIGATVAILIFDALFNTTTADAMNILIFGAIKTLIIGSIIGLAFGYLILVIIRRFLSSDELQNPVVLMLLFTGYILANYFQADSGLICVTLMGIIIANQAKTQVSHILDFKENLRIILIGFLFITLAGSIDLVALTKSFWPSFLLLIFLIFVARPLSVVCCTITSQLKWKEILFLSFMAPRGIIAAAISALFGLSLAKINYPEADVLAPMTFTIIAGTVIFYSIASPLLARKFKLAGIPDQGVLIIGANTLARKIGKAISDEEFPIQLIDTDYWKVSETKKYEIPVYLGNFLTFESEKPDGLNGIGKLLAMTDRDDVNCLAAIHFSEFFDQANLFQLQARTEKLPIRLMGRHLFEERCTYEYLTEKLEEGFVIKTTSITPEFTYKHWKEMYLENGIPLFFIRRSGVLQPITTEKTLPLTTSGKVIFMTKSETN